MDTNERLSGEITTKYQQFHSQIATERERFDNELRSLRDKSDELRQTIMRLELERTKVDASRTFAPGKSTSERLDQARRMYEEQVAQVRSGVGRYKGGFSRSPSPSASYSPSPSISHSLSPSPSPSEGYEE